jgi:hypothetical protein
VRSKLLLLCLLGLGSLPTPAWAEPRWEDLAALSTAETAELSLNLLKTGETEKAQFSGLLSRLELRHDWVKNPYDIPAETLQLVQKTPVPKNIGLLNKVIIWDKSRFQPSANYSTARAETTRLQFQEAITKTITTGDPLPLLGISTRQIPQSQ